MPDRMSILQALAAATLIAAAFVLIFGWPWRWPRVVRTPAGPGALSAAVQSLIWWRRAASPWAAAGGVLGVGLGYYAGVWLLGLRPHWPPREDQDRLLFILFPAVIAVEIVAAFAGRFRWLAWLPRLGVAATAAPVLLYGSTYLTDLAGPGTREWTPAQTWLILGGLATALACVWALLALLMGRAPGRSAPLPVAVASAGAAITIMLSGYASGGQPGLALAAA